MTPKYTDDWTVFLDRSICTVDLNVIIKESRRGGEWDREREVKRMASKLNGWRCPFITLLKRYGILHSSIFDLPLKSVLLVC